MIVLSCGHQVSDYEHTHDVMVKTTDKSGEKAIAYMIVCGSCEDRYRQSGALFDNESVAYAWASTEEW